MIKIMNKEFKRVHSTLDIVISTLLVVAGVVIVVIPSAVGVNILGCCLALCGVILFFTMKNAYKDAENGVTYSKKMKYFQASRKSELLDALKNDPSKADWTENGAGNGLRVDIYINRKHNQVFVHCAEYIPYNYQDCSDWFSYPLDQTGNLTK